MKRIILFYIIMIVGLSMKGQSFRPFFDNNVSFFQNSEKKIYALKVVDKQQYNDTIEYKFNSIWDFDNWSCISPNGISWNGNKCSRIDSVFYFFNINKDSIKILPFENVNAIWVAYKYTKNDVIVARISKKEISSFCGISDSIKTVIFQRQTINGSVINDLINNVSIEISKNYGFTKLIDFSLFPSNYSEVSLIGMTNPSFGKTYLTEKGIYNFDIGDEFHYDIAYSYPPNGTGRFSKVIKKVINKKTSLNNDTVNYTLQITDDEDFSDWGNGSHSHTIIVDTIIDKHIFNNKPLYVPDEPIPEGYYYYSYSLEADSNNRRVLTPSTYMLSYRGNCWHEVFYDPPQYSAYKEGCGLYYSNADVMPGFSHETMVYYKKGSEVWGTPYLINSIKEIEKHKVEIFPNPIDGNGMLNVSLSNNKISIIELFDLRGVLIKRINNINNTNYLLDLNSLPKGLYLLKITDEKTNRLIRKIIK